MRLIETNMSSQIMNLTNEIKDLLDYQRKLKVDTSIIKNSNEKLLERTAENERQC